MKAIDLRIGNLVTNEFYESFGDIIKVESIHDKGINVIASDDGRPYGMASPMLDFEYTFDKLRPIPLNEPWLCKLGLHSYELGYYNLTDEVTIDVEGQIRVENEYTTKRIWIAECYHVHSLMNFYSSLTGEELTVSE